MPPFANWPSGGGRKGNNSSQQARNTRTQPQKRKRKRETRQSKYQKTPSLSSQNNVAGLKSKDLPPIPSSDLFLDVPTPTQDNIARAQALHIKWKIEEIEQVLDGNLLVARQRQRCKDIRVAIFGFVLQEAQVDAICVLFYERRDLLLLA